MIRSSSTSRFVAGALRTSRFRVAHVCFRVTHVCFRVAYVYFRVAHVYFRVAHVYLRVAYVCFSSLDLAPEACGDKCTIVYRHTHRASICVLFIRRVSAKPLQGFKDY